MKDSYTDFHLDFGGTSVWYRVLWGQKRFYFIPPSAANLRAFIEWSTSKDQEDIFLGDLVMPGQCFYIDLMPGQTLFIPSAWIHAVYTPKDSLVFGGNFLHSTSILRQLQVYKVEMITKVKAVNRFPYFRQIHFYVLCSLLPPMRKKVDKPFGTTNENDDTDEDDEDLVAFSAAASSPLVFRQLPFLLNACQIWLDTSDVEEKDIFRKATSQLRLSPNEFLQEWWRLLKIIATNLDNGSVEKKEQTYIERFLSNPASELDVLDDAVISGALPEANNEPWALAAAAIAADAEANPKFPGVGRKVASTHIVTAREKQVLDTKNPLASSLSHLPNTTSNPPKNYSSVGDMGQPPPQSHVEIASGIEIKTLPIKDKEKHLDQDLNDVQSLSHDTLHAQTSSSMPPVKQRNSTEGYARGSLNSEREATQNLSNNVRIPLPESECEAKGTPIHPLPTLKLTLKAERSGETEPSNSVCPTLKLHLRNLPHTTSKRRRGANESSTTKQSKRRNIESVHDDSDDEDENESDEDSEVEDSEGETHISKTYVTRGKKLSSNYLERATDVAIGSGLCGGEWDDDDDDDEDGAYHEGDSIPGDSCDEAEDYDSDNDGENMYFFTFQFEKDESNILFYKSPPSLGPRHAKRTKEPKPKPASRPKAAPQPKKPRETSRQHLIKKLMKKR